MSWLLCPFRKKSVCFLFTHTLMTVFIKPASKTGLFVSLFQVNSQNEALLHVYICLKSGRSSAFSVLGSERSRINLQRHESHNEFGKNERAHSRETQEKKEIMRNWVHFFGAVQQWHSFALWLSSIAGLGQFWTWMEAFSKQEALVYSSRWHSPRHHNPLSSEFSYFSLLTFLAVSPFISPLHYLLLISPET